MNISPYFSVPLRQRIYEHAQTSYYNTNSLYPWCYMLCEHLQHPPETTTQEELREFQLFMVNHGVSGITINATLTALKFLFQITLDKPEITTRICPV